MPRLDPEFIELVEQTAKILGFTVVPDEDETYAGIHVDDPDGRTVFIHREWQDKKKLVVSGNYPGLWEDLQRAQRVTGIETVPRIGMTISRGAEVLAKEMKRRFLDDFIKLHDAVTDGMSREADARTLRHAAAKRLVSMLPGASANLERENERATSTDIRWYDGPNASTGYGDIHLNHDGTDARIELRSIPIATAELIVQALADAKKGES